MGSGKWAGARLIWRILVPLGVTGNTPDSGSGESWFDPRRGNSRRVNRFGWLALLLGAATPPDWSLKILLIEPNDVEVKAGKATTAKGKKEMKTATDTSDDNHMARRDRLGVLTRFF